jgi:nodulation protein E
MSKRRVVVTGLGVISALGSNRVEFWNHLCEGKTGIGPMVSLDAAQLRNKNAAEVRDFNPGDHFDPKQLSLLDRFAQFGLIAAREAISSAGIEWTQELKERTAVTTGSCIGGQQAEEKMYTDVYRDGRGKVHPLTVPRVMANSPASSISIEFGLMGPTYSVASACASSAHAMGQACWMVRDGLSELAVTGGSEAPFNLAHLKAWEAIRVVATDTCRPFSKNRSGMILGEGAAILVLEPFEAARARGAKIYGEILGFGMSADASHITQPDAGGAARAIKAALNDAGIRPEQVGYLNAHGTATASNDVMETQAIRMVFQEHADQLPVSSTKSMHGHALGAASAIEAAATVLALQNRVLPPTANFTEPDPECNLDVIPNESRSADVEFAVSNSFAFGGLNAALVFRAWRD